MKLEDQETTENNLRKSSIQKNWDDNDESLENILISLSLSEQEKIEQIEHLNQIFSQSNSTIQSRILSDSSQNAILNEIDSCSTELELSLLNLIEIGAQNGYGKIFIDKIEECLVQKVADDKINLMTFNSNSNVTKQLCRIFLQLINDDQISDRMLKLCTSIVAYEIKQLIKSIKESQNQDKQTQKVEINKENNNIEDLDELIRSATKTLNAFEIELSIMAQQNLFSVYNARITKSLTPLFHLNCSSQLKCERSITVRQTDSIQKLQGAVYRSLSYIAVFTETNYDLFQNHSIVEHLISLVLMPSANQSLNITEIIQQQFANPSYLFLISSAFKLLSQFSNLIEAHIELIDTTNNTKIIPYFTQFVKVGRAEYESDKEIQEYAQIRSGSQIILQYVLETNNIQIFEQLAHCGYIGALIRQLGTECFSCEESNFTIQSSLYCIHSFFLVIRGQMNPKTHSKYNPLRCQRELIKISEEQLEEEGGNEEIEYFLINLGNFNDCYTLQQASQAKESILNVNIYFRKKLRF